MSYLLPTIEKVFKNPTSFECKETPQNTLPDDFELDKNEIVVYFEEDDEVSFMIPQSLEKTFKEQNEKESLNESNTKLCSCCEDNFVAAYYCQECEDDICESCIINHCLALLRVLLECGY